MVTVILSIVWILVLSGLMLTSYLMHATLSSKKLLNALDEAERIGDNDFITDYPAFVNRMKIVKKGAKHPKRYCVERETVRFQREYKLMQACEEKKSSRHFRF